MVTCGQGYRLRDLGNSRGDELKTRIGGVNWLGHLLIGGIVAEHGTAQLPGEGRSGT